MFVSGTELRTDGQTNGQTDGWTDDPITRCPRGTFQARGIKTTHMLMKFLRSLKPVVLHSPHSTSALKIDVTEQNDVICDVILRKCKRQSQVLCSVENQKLRFYHTDHSPPKKLFSTKD